MYYCTFKKPSVIYTILLLYLIFISKTFQLSNPRNQKKRNKSFK